MGKQKEEAYEIGLLHLLQVLWSKAVFILIGAVLAAALLFFYARFLVTPLYRASTLIYVNNSSISLGSTSVSISTGELSAAQSLVKTYVVILRSRSCLEAVIEKSGVDLGVNQLRGMISAGSVNSTQIFEVSVTSPDPAQAKLLANTIAEVLPEKIADVVAGSSVRVVDYAVTPNSRVSPSYTKYAAIGLLIGAVGVAVVVLLLDFFDDVIHNEDYLLQTYEIPLLASIPDLTASHSDKYGYYSYGYGYGGKTYKKGGED